MKNITEAQLKWTLLTYLNGDERVNKEILKWTFLTYFNQLN